MDRKFLADIMLGRLARWLRILGYDTIYARKCIDTQIMVIAYKENRLILTRNTKLYKKLGSKRGFFVSYDGFKDQVKEVICALDMKFDSKIFLSRCADCNLSLISLPKADVQVKVPLYVYNTTDDFKTCPQCKRIFWSGSHSEEMIKIITGFWSKKGEQG